MPTREENSVEAKKSSYTEEELKDAYQKGRRVGQVEGMIAVILQFWIRKEKLSDTPVPYVH